jgi:Fe-S-cluster containining protein
VTNLSQVEYECDGCGACCHTYPIFAAESDAHREPRITAEGKRLAPWLEMPQWRYQLFPLPFHTTCCFLDTEKRCSIYATRPDVCRQFAAGSDQCQEARARAGLPPLQKIRHDHV